MFERYNLCVYLECDGCAHFICDTYFKSLDQVMKFIDRFDTENMLFNLSDELFPERILDVNDLLRRWRSKGDE